MKINKCFIVWLISFLTLFLGLSLAQISVWMFSNLYAYFGVGKEQFFSLEFPSLYLCCGSIIPESSIGGKL